MLGASILGLPSKTDFGRGTQITRPSSPDSRLPCIQQPCQTFTAVLPTAMTELERLAFLEQQAEEAYEAMYEAHSPSHAAACYSDAKEALYAAITVAQRSEQKTR
jgi:hypothetical protein